MKRLLLTLGCLFAFVAPAAAQVEIVPSRTTLPYANLFQPTQTTNTQPALHATCSWNAAGVTFTCAKVNVTDTASAVASLLLDLQVGGVSTWAVRKDGSIIRPAAGNYSTFIGGTEVLRMSGGSFWERTGVFIIGWQADLEIARAGVASLRIGSAADPFLVTTDAAKTALSAEGVSMADTATATLGASPIGKLIIAIGTDNDLCEFELRGSSNAVREVRDAGTICSVTAATATSVNVYWSAVNTRYEIENLRGGTRVIRAILLGS